MTFEQLDLSPSLLEAVREAGYTEPTPIQQKAIPQVLAGRDVLGIAQTGTGKTAAFALPTLDRLGPKRSGRRVIRCLVLAPTRELAAQIGESFETYGQGTGLRQTVIFGGVSQRRQESVLQRGVDILVATPGRLLDLMNQGLIDLRNVEIFVLDEADRMLDMGFIHDVRKVVDAIPEQRQTLFFSATMPQEITKLSKEILVDPIRVEAAPEATTAERVTQALLFVEQDDKRALLAEILRRPTVTRALVFTRTKHGANRVVKHLDREGISCAAIHGSKSQSARERALDGFRAGTVRVLVATDIAARGIDVDDVSHVVNLDLPNVPEQYVHRIGRTARAGNSGMALSFCDRGELGYLKDIEKTIRQEIPVVENHPYKADFNRNSEPDDAPHIVQARQRQERAAQRRQSSGRGGGGGGGGRRGGGRGRGGRR